MLFAACALGNAISDVSTCIDRRQPSSDACLCLRTSEYHLLFSSTGPFFKYGIFSMAVSSGACCQQKVEQSNVFNHYLKLLE